PKKQGPDVLARQASTPLAVNWKLTRLASPPGCSLLEFSHGFNHLLKSTAMRKVLPVLAFCLLGQPAAAQTYPAKPVNIVVSVPAGGTLDAIARMVARDLSESLGQQFVVENRPGANGNIAADYVRRSSADGHTLLMLASSTLTLGPYVMESVPFNPIKDFAP